jgi:hypothetical protein
MSNELQRGGPRASCARLPNVEHLSCARSGDMIQITVSRSKRHNVFINAIYRGLADPVLPLDRVDEARCITIRWRGTSKHFITGEAMQHGGVVLLDTGWSSIHPGPAPQPFHNALMKTWRNQ